MSHFREIKRRLNSVRGIRKITRAMRMVSMVKFRRAQAQLRASRPYAARLRKMAQRVLARDEMSDLKHFMIKPGKANKLLVVTVASDRGLCGAFNANLARLVQGYLDDFTACPENAKVQVELFIIGSKAAGYYRASRRLSRFKVMQSLPFSETDAGELARQLMDLYSRGSFDRIDIFFNEFVSGMHQERRHKQLLPLNLAEIGERQQGRAIDCLFEPALPDLLDHLLPRLFRNQLKQIMLSSNTAEQSARMNMMNLASRNADELIEELNLEYHKARQAAITTELEDIITGAEAVA